MEELESQKGNIKEYVQIINPAIEDNDFLDYVIDSVVERSLIYMNRLQLDDDDVSDFYSDSDDVPPVLPAELERTLAEVVVGAYRNMQALPTAGKEVTSLSDNGQTVNYSDSVSSFLNRSDSEIFSSAISLLNQYRLPTIVEPSGSYAGS